MCAVGVRGERPRDSVKYRRFSVVVYPRADGVDVRFLVQEQLDDGKRTSPSRQVQQVFPRGTEDIETARVHPEQGAHDTDVLAHDGFSELLHAHILPVPHRLRRMFVRGKNGNAMIQNHAAAMGAYRKVTAAGELHFARAHIDHAHTVMFQPC